jgi:signal transduction histidine kinase
MGILGHDLRNPLNTVIVTSDRLLRGQGGAAADERASMLRIRRAAGRMQEMIETLLDFTRARFTGQVPVSRAAIDLGEISGTTIDELRTIWPDNRIELEVHGDPRGEWDPARMSQTVANLVTNAIAYGGPGHSVRVSVDDAGPDVELKVHNEGPPIPPDVMKVIFEPFRRGAAEDRSPGGLGLGLYIVKEIVNAHSGSIGVDSTERDGTTFTLHLPRHATYAAMH